MKLICGKVLLTTAFVLLAFNGLEAGKGKKEVLLKGVAEYCDRLQKEVFHFFCYEKIVESIEQELKYPERNRALKNFLDGNPQRRRDSRYEVLNATRDRQIRSNYASRRKVTKNIYLHDYQIIKENWRVRERRRPLKVDEKIKKVSGRTVIYSYKAALSPVMLFSAENQKLYDYKLGKKKRVMGRKTQEVIVRKKNSKTVLVSAWIDREDFSILKFNVFPEAIKGYNEIMHLNKKNMANINVKDVHYFGYLRNGLRYPTKTEIYISYDREPRRVLNSMRQGNRVLHGARVFTKLQTLVHYKDYQFFNTGAGNPVFQNLEGVK